MRGRSLGGLGIAWLFSLLPFGGAGAEGIDLSRSDTRCVEVKIEVRANDQEFSPWLPAELMSRGQGSVVEVTLSRENVERELFPSEEVIEGTFEPFRWSFDVETAQLIAASTQGRIHRSMEVGFLSKIVEVDIAVELRPGSALGRGRIRKLLGQTFVSTCKADADTGCTAIPTVTLQADTGEMAAPSVARAQWRGISLESIAALGRARFRESDETCRLRDAA